jgi:hypothetical protein
VRQRQWLTLLDLHTAQPVRDLVMFMRAAECVDESIMTPFGGIRVDEWRFQGAG